jgi:hypothetical protein
MEFLAGSTTESTLALTKQAWKAAGFRAMRTRRKTSFPGMP